MLVEETITYLKMTAPDQLVPGRLPPAPIVLERHDHGSLGLLRSVYARIRAPRGWVTRPAWSDAQWREWLSHLWLQTSSRDHPHAKANYERRGFRAFRTEQRRREVPGPG